MKRSLALSTLFSRAILMCAPVMATAIWPAAAQDITAPFIKGTYVMEGRCDKQAKIDAGGPKNVETVPETLTESGFEAWESSCAFLSITEKTKDRVWVAEMSCGEEAEESEETDTFELSPDGQTITVTVEDKTTKFVRCGAEKGN